MRTTKAPDMKSDQGTGLRIQERLSEQKGKSTILLAENVRRQLPSTKSLKDRNHVDSLAWSYKILYPPVFRTILGNNGDVNKMHVGVYLLYSSYSVYSLCSLGSCI